MLAVLSSVAGLRHRSDMPVYAPARPVSTHTAGHYRRACAVAVRQWSSYGRGRCAPDDAGLPDAPFTIDPDEIARIVAGRLRSGRPVIYAPGVLRPVMGVLRALPAPLFRRVTTAARRRVGPADSAGSEHAS